MRHRQPAICLRVNDYSETSQVVAFLTRAEGVVRLLAKGTKRAKSKSGGAIDLLSEGDLVFTLSRSGGLGTLVEFTETVSHTSLRRRADRLSAALYVIELAGEMLAPDDPHPEVFDLLHNALARLAQEDAPIPAVVAYFQWRLLRNVGLLGELDRCVGCGARISTTGGQRGLRFSSTRGGMLCATCGNQGGESVGVSGETAAALAALAAAETGRKVTLGDDQAERVNGLLSYHITYQLGKPLKLARHVISPKRP